MRRIIFSSLLVTVCAALVLAPGALAKGKPLPPSITKVSISGLPKEGERCPISTTVEYSGKAAHGDYAITVFEPSGNSQATHTFKKSPFTYTDSIALADVPGEHSFKVELYNKDKELLSDEETSPFSVGKNQCFLQQAFSSYPFVDLTASPGDFLRTSPTGTAEYLYLFPSASTGAETFTVTNSGSATSEPLELKGATNNNEGGFTSANNNCDGKALAPGATCTFDVKFALPTCTPEYEFGGAFNLLGKESLVNYLALNVEVLCPES